MEIMIMIGATATGHSLRLALGSLGHLIGKPASTGLAGSGRSTRSCSKAWQGPALPVLGGNISRDLARRLVREGSAALPATLATTLDKAPLPRTAQATLDADILESHCGQLPASRVPGMRLAQRARDAAMATTLLDLNRKPALLVAGNGHVRTDYGVPVLLSELRPGARILSIGFLEEGRSASDESSIPISGARLPPRGMILAQA